MCFPELLAQYRSVDVGNSSVRPTSISKVCETIRLSDSVERCCTQGVRVGWIVEVM